MVRFVSITSKSKTKTAISSIGRKIIANSAQVPSSKQLQSV